MVRWGDSNNVLIQSLREEANNKNTWQRENNWLKVWTGDFSRGVLHNSSHERREILREYIFQRLQLARAVQDRAIWLALEKFTRADISQIALEIMWLFMHENSCCYYLKIYMKKAWKSQYRRRLDSAPALFLEVLLTINQNYEKSWERN